MRLNEPLANGIATVTALLLLSHIAWTQTTVYVSPAVKHALPSGIVKVDVVVSNVSNLHSALVTLAFDNTVLRYDRVDFGPLLSTNGDNTFTSRYPSPGSGVNAVTVDQAILGPGGVDGTGVLFSINFTALKAGSSSLSISTADMTDVNDEQITVTTQSGTIAVGYPSTAYANPAYNASSSGGHEFGYDAYTSVSSAVAAVSPGGTVIVAPSTYVESVNITKSLTLSSSGVPIIQNLTVDATSVNLGASTQVSGTLSLVSGALVTGSFKVIVANSSPSAVAITNGSVNGELERVIAAGSTGSYLFTNLHTRIIPSGTQGSLVVSLRSFPGTYPPNTTTGKAIYRYYSITPTGSLSATLQLGYLDAELNGIAEGNLTLFRYTGSEWVGEGGGVVQAENYIERANVSSWSLWTLADVNLPLPITLASFTASVNPVGKGVQLDWSTASEVNNYGFFVQRKTEGDSLFTDLMNSFIPGHGTTLEVQRYSYEDGTVPGAGRYFYRLRQVNLDGSQSYTAAVGVYVQLASTSSDKAKPVQFHLQQNYPNPFNPSTRIMYSLPTGGEVTVKVYSLLGQEIATLVSEHQDAGEHGVDFNASNLANGIYLYSLRAGKNHDVRRMVLLK